MVSMENIDVKGLVTKKVVYRKPLAILGRYQKLIETVKSLANVYIDRVLLRFLSFLCSSLWEIYVRIVQTYLKLYELNAWEKDQ